MHIDYYTKLMLTLIAGCLLMILFRSDLWVDKAVAQAAITCKGELKANESGGTEAIVGGYQIQVSCR